MNALLSLVVRRLVEISWQVALLVLAVLLVQALLSRRLPPRWRYALWWIVVLRCVLPVLPQSPWSVYALFDRESAAAKALPSPAPTRPVTTTPSGPIPIDAPRAATPDHATTARIRVSPADRPANPWMLAGWAWLVGATASLLLLLAREAALFRRLRSLAPIEAGAVVGLADDCRRRIGIRRRIRLLRTPGGEVPGTTGLFRPAILLSDDALARLPDDALRAVLLHEMEHVRRHDALVSRGLDLLGAVYWFHPLVRLALGRLRAERETVRDLAALRHAPDLTARSYGRTILALLDKGTRGRPAPLVSLLSRNRDIHRRITMLVRFSDRPRRGLLLGAALTGFLALITLTGAGPAAGQPGDDRTPAPRPPARGAESTPPPSPAEPLVRIPVEFQSPPTEQEEKLRGRLGVEKVSFTFRQTPLPACLAFLATQTHINFFLSPTARDNTDGEAITLTVGDMPLERALDVLTAQLHVDYVVRGDVVEIAAPGEPVLYEKRIYGMKPLLDMREADDDGEEQFYDRLADVIQSYVIPEAWEEDPATLRIWAGLLVVNQTARVHRRLERFLTGLVNRGRGTRESPGESPELAVALAKPLSLSLQDVPLSEVVATLQRDIGVPVRISENLPAETYATLQVEDLPARTALRLVASQAGGVVEVQRDAVLLTDRPSMELRIYDIRRLFPSAEGEELVDLIGEFTQSSMWDLDGARMEYWLGLLLITQTPENQTEIAAFLDTLRRARK